MLNRTSALNELETMTVSAMRDFWRREFGVEPPGTACREFLRHEAAWKIQTDVYGDLSPRLQRRLRDLLGAQKGDTLPRPARQLRAGTSLVREWKGTKHTVDVVEDGFVYAGTRYKTLSSVARAITGTQWSGPVFFGLKVGRTTGARQ